MVINPSVAELKKSATLKITALTKKLVAEGKDVVNFAAGEPDFDTPDFIKEAGKAAIDAGFTKYTPSAGLPDLRKAIASKLQSENNISLEGKNVIVTAGAKYALYVALFTLLKPGDEVIIPSPYWVSYPQMAKLCQAKPVFCETDEKDGFKLSGKKLQECITSKSKVLILNYPSNPTGATYDRKELEEICRVVKDNNLYVVSDEIYETLLYDGRQHTSFAALGGAFNNTITVNGFSKTFSMTGWRLGYLAGPDEIIGETSKIIDHTTSCACAVSQKAAIAALGDNKWQGQVKDIFAARRDRLWKGLDPLEKITPFKSQGTFYMFSDIRKTNLNSFDFSQRLLSEKLVSCIPADAFGKDGFIRLSFSTSDEQIDKGIERIKDFLSSL